MVLLSRTVCVVALAIACAGPPRDAHPPPLDAHRIPPTREDCSPAQVAPEACPRPASEDLVWTREHYEQVRSAREIGDLCAAAQLAARAAGEDDPRWWMLRAQLEREVGWMLDALASARRCAALADDARITAICRPIADELAARVASITIEGRAPPGSSIALDGGWRDLRDGERVLYVEPGHQRILLFVPDVLCCRESVEIEDGDRIEIDLDRIGDDCPHIARVLSE